LCVVVHNVRALHIDRCARFAAPLSRFSARGVILRERPAARHVLNADAMQHQLAARLRIAALLYILTPALAHADQPAHASPDQPSVVLVHGLWADGSSWDKVVPLLEAKGYRVVAVHLPLTSTADDVAATTRAIEQQPGDVILVGHSYGGNVITQAGNNPKVKGLVYVDAFALDDGETINGLMKAKPPAWAKTLKIDSGGFAWMPPESIAKDFAQDLPAAEQKQITVKQGPAQTKSLDDPMKNPAWKNKRSWYVRGTADRMIDPVAQAMMAKRIKAKLTNVDTSHVAMLSKPREVANVIIEAATAPATTASRDQGANR
jgi:pimeloyl-ACP methyl ester carboxylesterase